MIFSVAINGSLAFTLRSIIFPLTTSPEVTLMYILSIESTARNASATEMRLFAESSSVRSNHCVAEVNAGLSESQMTYLASAQIRSERMGFLLYGIADEPI